MKKVFSVALAATALTTFATPASAVVNIIKNGSFENGFAFWSQTNAEVPGTGASAPVVIAYNQASNYPTGAYGELIPTDNASGNISPDAAGNFGLYLSSDTAFAPNNAQTISQAVTLTQGVNYLFGFDWYLPQNGLNNPNGATFKAALDGVTFATFSLVPGSPATTWFNTSQSSNTIGGAGTFNFSFTADGYPAKDIVIDRVYLIAAVPEPATWAMLVLGFGLVGAAARRRKSVAAAF